VSLPYIGSPPANLTARVRFCTANLETEPPPRSSTRGE